MSGSPKAYSKFTAFIELMEMMDRAFIHKLKVRRPDITEEEIAAELKSRYMTRPGAERGDADGVVGDLSRFRS